MKRFVALLILVTNSIASDPYDDQPKILVNDGNLIFESADSKDVRVKLKGNSRFLVNDLDILNAIKPHNSTFLTPVSSSLLGDILSQVNALKRTVRSQSVRIARFEMGIGGGNNSNSSVVAPADRRRINLLTRKVRALEITVANLTERLSKDYCKSYPCQNGGTCFTMFDTFRCECTENWEGPTCNLDVNECAKYVGTDLGCQNGATCINTVGSYECSCTQSWKGKNCNRQKMDCLSVPQTEICGQGICVPDNNKDGFSCICKQGWRNDNNSRACTQDVDECNEMRPHCSVDPKVLCINIPGSFVCGPCPEGYTGNGFFCEDIDECQLNNGGCSVSPKVECINTRGSFRCSNCPFGFEGDGKTCTATSISVRPNSFQCADSSVCNANALCYQYPNSPISCICKNGYTGNGFGENGCVVSTVDPCSVLYCRNGGQCVRNGTSAYCNCPAGTTLPFCQREINYCIPNPCLNNGNCTQNRIGARYRCSCLSGFTGSRCQTPPSCGGVLTDLNNTLKYPFSAGNYQHNAKCAWLIKTNNTKVLNITFKSFNLESSNECRFDWLQIHDGPSAAAHMRGRFCGKKGDQNYPKDFISTHNSLYLWFRSDNSTSHAGFELTWDSIDPQCGGMFNVSTHGTVASPGSPGNYPLNSECEWILEAPPGKRIQFLFFTLQIESHVNCSYDYLEIHSGDSIEMPSLGKFCNSTVPPPLLSPSNIATIHFHSDNSSNDAGFQIAYSVVEGIPGCGGHYTASKGDISSPMNIADGKYKHNLMCDYVIRMPVNTRVRLEFMKFELEESVSCKFDKLEIYEGTWNEGEEGLIGRYCGTQKPPMITSQSNIVSIKFTTDWSASEEGFQLSYKLICGGIYTADSGVISSPNYPNNYEADRNCEYDIVAPQGKIIVLNVLDLDIEQHASCDFDYLEIYGGPFADNSTILGKFCGDYKPGLIDTFTTKHNQLLVHFTTDASVHGRGFQANYSFVDVQCGGIITDAREVVRPPMDIDANGFYQSNANCQWLVYAPKGFVIQINILSFELEYDNQCRYDFVKIFNNGSGNGEEIGPFCGVTIPKVITTSDNLATILFQSDSSTAKDGFNIGFSFVEASRQCGGNFFISHGFLRSPGTPQYFANKECEWILTVPNGKQIEVKFNYFELETHTTCKFDGLEIRNGGNNLAPLLNKFCGETVPPPFKSMSNQLYFKFYSDSSRAGRGFELEWDGTTFGCGGLLSASKGAITSPNYPATYPHNSQCEWRVSVNEGSSIQIVFSDLDLETHAECKYDYLEIFDGSDASAYSYGKFCSNEHHPMHIETSGNHATIRMSSDESHSGRGFHIKYSTKCNRTIHANMGAIESPNFPEDYGNNIDCAWTILVSKGNTVNMQFSHFELENDNIYHNETNEHVCKYDFVTIYDLDYEENDKKIAKSYCNAAPEIRNSTTDAVVVLFHTDPAAVASGFRLEWFNVGCGGRLAHSEGTLTSPDYPQRYKHDLICIWEIVVEFGYSVNFTVHDLDIERSQDCQFDSLIVAHDSNFTNHITKICRPINDPLSFVAEGHQIFVKFETDESTSRRGFNITYNTIKSDCGGLFTSPNGIIKTSQYPTKNYEHNKTCEWNIKTDTSHTLTFQLTDFDVEESNNCSKDHVEIFDPVFNETLWKGCGHLPNDPVFRSKRNELTVRLVTDDTISAKGFIGNYSLSCGGRVVTNESGEFVYRRSTNERECYWTIISEDPSKHVTVTFTYLSLFSTTDFEPCVTDISVFEGDVDSLGARKSKFCGGKAPQSIVSNGNALTIKLNSTSFPAYAEFDIHYSVMDNACGGSYKSLHGEFASPLYPNTSPLSSYCIWNIVSCAGNLISLEIKSLDIATSQNCNENYLEIRKESERGDVIGVYCGNSVPTKLLSAPGYWIKYKTDQETPSNGFLLEYKYVDLSDLSGKSGIIQSPAFPKFVRNSYDGAYRILVQQGSVIRIEFNEFYMYVDEDDEECYSYIKIYNGYDETAPIIDEYCDQKPEAIISDTNVIFIKYYNGLSFMSKFELSWNEVEKNFTQGEDSLNKCGNELISLNSESDVINLTSPGYPNGYDNNIDCTWTIVSTLPSYRPAILFKEVDLEEFDECNADSVTVLRSREDSSWVEVEKLCITDIRERRNYFGTPSLQVKFHSDYNKNQTGFLAELSLECGGLLTEPDGVIEFNSSVTINSFQQSCMWNVTVKRGRKIQFEFLEINIKNRSSICSSYVIIKNGVDDGSPFLGNGQYCGDVRAEIPQTSSNRAFVKFKSEYITTGASFKLRYYEVQHSCGGQIKLTSLLSSTVISSPNYPNIPQPHIECVWTIIGPMGEKMRMDFLERFDLASGLCKNEYLELREGSTAASGVINKFCGNNLPATQYTRSNILRVKYFTDNSEPNNGFKANISIGFCGGMVRAALNTLGFITSPKYPGIGTYPANTTCDYRIVATSNSIFNLNVIDIDLAVIAESESGEELIEECNLDKDHLLIYSIMPDINSTNGEQLTEIARLCGNVAPKQLIMPASNEVLVRLKTFPRTKVLYRGFKISYNASRLNCGGTFNVDSGVIMSDGYPNSRLNRGSCIWQVTVRKGRKIKIEFLDVDLASSEHRYIQRIGIFNDFRYTSRVATITNASNPGVFYTTDNTALISLWVRVTSNNRGFKLRFSSDEPTVCEGDLNRDEGYVYQPSGRNLTSFSCTYIRDNLPIMPSNTGTIAYYFTKLSVGDTSTGSCAYSSAYVKVIRESGVDDEEKVLAHICGNDTKEMTVLSPWQDIKIETRRSSLAGDVNYTLYYKKHNCGAILKGASIIRNVPASSIHYRILDCAWSIKYEEGSSASLTVNNLNLKLPCDKEWLKIYNGPSSRSPLMTKLCNEDLDSKPLLSQRGSLFIEYHTDDFLENSKNSIFEIKSEPSVFACGGILHKFTKNLKTPLYDKPYPPNTECIWEIRADDGYHVGLNFEGRFFIEQSDNCTKDFVEFYDYVDNDWKFLRRICGRDTPKPVNSTSSKMKVIFRSDESGAGDGFNATWQQNCGGVIMVDEKTRILSSPGYPKGYQGRLDCNYTFSATGSEESFVNIKFTDFELEETTGKCIYDSVTIFKRLEYITHAVEYTKVGTYCGRNNPGSVRYKKEVVVELKTDQHDHMKGFQIEYNIDTCGGWVKNSSVISSPQIIKNRDIYDYAGSLTCTWNITAPRDKKIVIKFERFNFQYSEYCTYDYVQIYNGSVEEDKNSLVRLCHNLTIPPIVIENNEAIVKMRTDQVFSYIGFSAIISFKQKCDERIVLTKQNPSHVIDKGNQVQANNLECIFRVTGEPMSFLKVSFDQMHLSICDPDQHKNATCDCDYLEILDGNGPFSQVIGRFCGHDVDRNVFSTGSSLYIRFVTDGNRPSTGFKLTINMQESPCGSQPFFNITEQGKEVFTLTSPKLAGQSKYLPNLRCMWTFEAPYRDTLEITFTKFNVEDSDNCTNDYLRIEDDFIKEYITEGLGAETTYRGQHSYVQSPNFYMGVTSPIGAHIYCGSSLPHEYFSQSAKLRIYFVSNSANEFDGFNLTVRTINACSRNFTALQGRYSSGNQPESCKTTITVPEDYTISLYFYRFFFMQNDCEKSSMKIYDGDFDNGALLHTLCSYSTPNPIFSTGNQVSIVTKFDNSTGLFGRGTFDILYVASRKSNGRGCGGDIYNYGGYFTSPLYPSNNRTNYDCTWSIKVPQNLKVAMKFTVFDMGTKLTCENDYVEILEANESREFVSIKRYCGEDKPAVFVSANSQMKIHYMQTVNFAGTGWTINFMGVHEGATPSDW